MAQKAQVGDEVFIPELEQFGKVETVRPDGRITKVAVNTPKGKEVIDTEELEVIFAIILRGIAKWFAKLIKGAFKKKKRK